MPDKQTLIDMRMPCAVCAGRCPDIHHKIQDGYGKMGGKADDSQCMTLCRKHHNELHQSVRKFEAKYGTQTELMEKLDRWITGLRGV